MLMKKASCTTPSTEFSVLPDCYNNSLPDCDDISSQLSWIVTGWGPRLPRTAINGTGNTEDGMKVQQSPIQNRLGQLVLVSSCGLLVIWMVGQYFRDRTWLSGLMFYFPTPVFVVWLLGAMWYFTERRKQIGVLLVIPAFFLLALENQWVRPSSVGHSSVSSRQVHDSVCGEASETATGTENPGNTFRLRLLHWNMARGVMGWKQQRRLIESFQPDIVMLSETPSELRVDSFSEFNAVKVSDMLVACKGDIVQHRRMSEADGLNAGNALDVWLVDCDTRAGRIRLAIADMSSFLNIHRHPYLRPLVLSLPLHEVDICAGDFNAPRRSLAFADLPDGYVHGYEAAGAGWSFTWPVPVPCLAIDQCITGPRVNPLDYQLHSSMLSDHRIQVLDFELAPPGVVRSWKESGEHTDLPRP